jgi:general secretion pathway protein M
MNAGNSYLSPKQKRVLALALLFLVIVLPIAAIAGLAWMGHRHYDGALFTMTRQLKSQSAINSTRPQLLEAVELLKAKDIKRYFLKGASPALAGAELQDLIKAVVEQNSGRVQSIQTLAHKDSEGYRQLTATVQMSVNVPNLRNALHALESREPYLFVDNLTIRSQSGFGYKPPPGAPEQEHFVQMDVSAFVPLPSTDVSGSTNAEKPGATPPRATGGKA